MTRTLISRSLLALALVGLPAVAVAQQPTQHPGSAPSGQATPASSPVEFSGVLYPQFIYGGAKGNTRSNNQFQLERAYLNARAKVADRTSIRLTADVYRPGAGLGYTMRAKYAYVQYDYWMNNEGYMGTVGQARLGMQQTVIIDQEEQLFPRWIAPTAVERAGFFSSSDLGLSTTIGFGNGTGEVYVMASNGPGYTQPEVDRFKDYQARITFNLLGNIAQPTGGFIVTPWYYKGTVASALRPAEGRKHDRVGVLAGWKSPVLTLGGQLAQSTNENERLNAGNVVTEDRSGKVLSVYTVARPFALLNANGNKTWGAVLRWDAVSGDNAYVPNAGAFPVVKGKFLVAGIVHDVNNKFSWSVDYQQQSPQGAPAAPLDLRTYNVHAAVSF
ncbi:MAG TPA: hypothetical protein VF761_17720 [Gemmatimonadaceae bacterium]